MSFAHPTTTCDKFFVQLYPELWKFGEGGHVHSKPRFGTGSDHPEINLEPLHASHPNWNRTEFADWGWQILGTPTDWRLRVWDDNLLGRDRPYDLIPYHSRLFLGLCEEFCDPHHPEPDKRMDYCVGSLVVAMEEKLLGQTVALHAYEAGATATDPPQLDDIEEA